MILFKRTFILFVIQLAGLTFCVNAQIANHETGYIQTDRTVYVAGESVFYKLYVLDATSKKRSDLSKVGYILLRNANPNPIIKIRIKIDSGLAAGSFVLPDTLTSGMYQLIAFTSEMKNFGEQRFIHKEIAIVNRFDKELNFKLINSGSTENSKIYPVDVEPEIKTDKLAYACREKVRVSLGKINSKANVSVSVFEDPGIASTDKSIVETLAGLSTIQPDKKTLNTYLPETKGKIIRGRVIDETTQKTIKDATVLLSCMDSIPNLQYAVTNSVGMFQMLLSDYYNGKELFFTIKDMPANQHWKIETEDEFALSDAWNPTLTEAKDNFKKFSDKSQNIVYINKCYQLNNVLITKPVADNKYICPQLYHCPVSTVLLSDFVSLNDLPEIVVELLPQLRIYNDNGKYSARVMFESSNLYYDKPAVFLDGVFVDDLNKIIGLGSEQIKKIDIVESERAFGNLIFEGIISITSKSNEILNTTPASYSLRIKNDNFNQGGSFVDVNPDSIKDKNIPYYKQLLYWNPNLVLSGTDSTKFEFYTSDNTANFIIKVEGVSDDGTPISASSTIQVNNKLNANVK